MKRRQRDRELPACLQETSTPFFELYGTRYQSGSFSLINVGSGFHCLQSYSLFSFLFFPAGGFAESVSHLPLIHVISPLAKAISLVQLDTLIRVLFL